jgi:Cu-processing system permease protein
MVAFNPIDLARVIVLLQMDISALMGVTGAVLRESLGSVPGAICAFAALALWMVLPLALAVRIFRRKDL